MFKKKTDQGSKNKSKIRFTSDMHAENPKITVLKERQYKMGGGSPKSLLKEKWYW